MLINVLQTLSSEYWGQEVLGVSGIHNISLITFLVPFTIVMAFSIELFIGEFTVTQIIGLNLAPILLI